MCILLDHWLNFDAYSPTTGSDETTDIALLAGIGGGAAAILLLAVVIIAIVILVACIVVKRYVFR